jgi:NAD(P)H-hydrate epimerase
VKLLTAAQVRALEHDALETLEISSAALMRRASDALADIVLELLPTGGSVAVFCGAGNNGGDGIGCAAELLRRGVAARVFLVGERRRMSADAVEMELRLREYGGELEAFDDAPDVAPYTDTCAIIADAIFGIGLTRDIDGAALDAVRLINNARATVVSADIPSGVDADTGLILGDAVRADVTATFIAPKIGLYVAPGAAHAGRVVVCDIGVPEELTADAQSRVFVTTPRDFALPQRKIDVSKGDCGRVLIVAGSVGYTGAPVLAARAATRTGAGLVFLGVPRGIYAIAAAKCVGEICFPLAGGDTVEIDAWSEIEARLERADALLIGPGLRNTDDTRVIVESALNTASCPIILDADGINALAANINALDKASRSVILTPHDGEFARLGGDPSHGRLTAAQSFAAAHNVTLILKGFRTIIASPDGTAFINTRGTPSMAKGGSGDVLAGMIAALLAQGLSTRDACVAAVYLHGRAGEIATARLGVYSVDSEDITDAISVALNEYAEARSCTDFPNFHGRPR